MTSLTNPLIFSAVVAEEWKTIPHYEPYRINAVGTVINKKGMILKTHYNHNGYLVVYLYCDKRNHRIPVHQLVSWTFIGPQPGGFAVHHKDSNKLNNHYLNLEYVQHCLHTAGEKSEKCKLKTTYVILIRNAYKNNLASISDMARLFGVDRATISQLIHRKTWKSLK